MYPYRRKSFFVYISLIVVLLVHIFFANFFTKFLLYVDSPKSSYFSYFLKFEEALLETKSLLYTYQDDKVKKELFSTLYENIRNFYDQVRVSPFVKTEEILQIEKTLSEYTKILLIFKN